MLSSDAFDYRSDLTFKLSELLLYPGSGAKDFPLFVTVFTLFVTNSTNHSSTFRIIAPLIFPLAVLLKGSIC